MTTGATGPFVLRGSSIVVTGAGSGIGRALVERFVTDGANVVANDLDEGALARTVFDFGVAGVPGDAATDDGARRLVDESRHILGDIDLFCANAGVAPIGGPWSAEHGWEQAWEVNVMAHVRASRYLLERWLARGRGHFLATVSAAGLLSMLGSAPYSVTKHAALAYAEWMAATYGHRGITVQCLCPQGVRTPMLEGTGEFGLALLGPGSKSPQEVAAAVVAGLADGRFLILPHPEVAGWYAARAADTDRWLKGMQRLQVRLDAAAG